MKKRYLIHYFDPSVESTLSPIVELDDKEILDYCASLKAQGCVEIHYTHYDQESGAPKNPYIDYPPIKHCPVCGRVPSISYACGEYFVDGREGCSFCGVGGTFSEMHASKDGEVDAWNEAVSDETQCKCPLGGDETDDCADCAYSPDYHFVDGECVERTKTLENDKKKNMAYWDTIDETCYEAVRGVAASSQTEIDEDELEEAVTEIGAEIRDIIVAKLKAIGGKFPFVDENY